MIIPKAIQNNEEYEAALHRIKEIFDVEPGTPEAKELDVLVDLVEKYEDIHCPIDPPDVITARIFREDQEKPFGVDFLNTSCNNTTLALWLLYQSGPLKELGYLDEGDQLEVLEFNVSVFEIIIVVRVGSTGKPHTFKLKTIRN